MPKRTSRSGRVAIGLGVGAVFAVGLLVATTLWLNPGLATLGAGAASPSPLEPSPARTASPGGIPTRETTGVPAGWQPKTDITGEYRITEEGAVVEDLRLTDGVLYVLARGVTLRRVELVSARIINDYSRVCYNDLLIEDATIRRGPKDLGMPAIESGGYTAVRLQIDGASEGLRVGEKASGCGPVVLEDSWLRMDPPEGCESQSLWHGDGVQGYEGPEVTVRHSYIELTDTPECPGTAAFFYSDQGNTHATVEDVVLAGGAYVFRLGTPGRVSGLKVVEGSWGYGPVDVQDCSVVEWGAGNEIVRPDGQEGWTRVEPLECRRG